MFDPSNQLTANMMEDVENIFNKYFALGEDRSNIEATLLFCIKHKFRNDIRLEAY